VRWPTRVMLSCLRVVLAVIPPTQVTAQHVGVLKWPSSAIPFRDHKNRMSRCAAVTTCDPGADGRCRRSGCNDRNAAKGRQNLELSLVAPLLVLLRHSATFGCHACCRVDTCLLRDTADGPNGAGAVAGTFRRSDCVLRCRKKLPFFLYIYSDESIVVARGASGGLALWGKADVEWQAKNGVLRVYQ
jgi:hypothetical protein